MTAAPDSAPFFGLHHGPVGSWLSLWFGAKGEGVAIGAERGALKDAADFVIGARRGGRGLILPLAVATGGVWGWDVARDAVRKSSVSVDEFISAEAGLAVRFFTPHAALPNPRRSGNLQYATAPGILIEVTLDNSAHDQAAHFFAGIGGAETLRPLDWSMKTLCGVGAMAGAAQWVLAATAAPGEVFTLQAQALDEALAGGARVIDPTATNGGIAVIIPPRTIKTINMAFAAYRPGAVTHGIDARYLYTAHFPRVEAVANFLLHNAGRVKESCASLDGRVTTACGDAQKLALFSRALRAYDAGTQVLDAGTAAGGVLPYFATIAPTGERNSLERAVDFLPWELQRDPWVVRNIFDLATAAYAYHDKVRFPGDADSPDEPREGGMTFARDFGFANSYAPSAAAGGGASAFDGGGTEPGWSGGAMATESLLNGIYLLTGYALVADDTPWAKTRLPFARELLISLENRDHWDPAKRTGILKAESVGAGPATAEVTAFHALHPSLAAARGNLYLAVKTFCANLLLTTYFQNNNDLHSADYSYAFAQKTAAAIVAAFSSQTQFLPANLLTPTAGSERLLAAFEPLAIPTYLGLTTTLAEYFPDLFGVLKAHAIACLQPSPEGCLAEGTLRLTSADPRTLPGKLIAAIYVLEKVFAIDLAPIAPEAWPGIARLPDEDAARQLTSALFVKPSTA